MFELFTDIPEPIQHFYTEEVRNEPTGEMVEESYTYFDEEENELTGTRSVAEYVNNTYVVQLARPQQVSWAKVETLTEKHAGSKDEVIDKFIELATETDDWAFHDRYIAWMEDCAEVDTYNETEQLNEDGEPIEFELKVYSDEPTNYQSTDSIRIKTTRAKAVRDTARYQPITVEGMSFDADEKSYENLTGTIANWETLIADKQLESVGLISDSKMYWTLSDDSVVLVTKETLQKVVGALSVRVGLLQAQYAQEKVR